MKIRHLLLACALVSLSTGAFAQTTIKLGVLTDMSGPYADLSGRGSMVATQMAGEEFMKANPGYKVEVVFVDHQNKPDIASAAASKWFDVDGVDAVTDVANSAVALATSEIAKTKNKVLLGSGPATSDLTSKACSPNTVHWTYDTYGLSNGTGTALTKAGGNKWFFVTANYAFGQAMERDTSEFVKAAGGEVLGSTKHPLNNSDFSSFLLQAQSSGANVIGLANAGSDVINTIKQAAEFGITQKGVRLAGLLVFITDVRSLGLQAAQGLVVTESYYWDFNDQTRAFAKRFAEKMDGRMPTQVQAGAYSATRHYLKAVAELKSAKDGAAVVAKMKQIPVEDEPTGKGYVRKDGRRMQDMHVFQVKTPAESKGGWDYYKLIATIPAEQAFRPIEKGECAMAKQ